VDGQLVVRDLARERAHVRDRARACAGQPDVGRVDAEFRDQVQDLDLLTDARVRDGWALQPVAERLIIEFDRLQATIIDGIVRRVPVVDKILLLHGTSRYRGTLRKMDGDPRPCQRGRRQHWAAHHGDGRSSVRAEGYSIVNGVRDGKSRDPRDG
jgi:hypothetical protein